MKKLFSYLLIVLMIGLLGKSSAQPEITCDIYCSGNNGPGEFKDDNACYWKNGQTFQLSPLGSRASGLFVLKQDIIVSGEYLDEDGHTKACYWKNGELTKLPSSSNTTYTSSIYVDKKDIYISGHYDNEKFSQACYWKNGVLTDLEHKKDGSCFTRSIIVKGKDIYVAGYCAYAEDNVHHIDACYWKNGNIKILDREPYMLSIACEMAFNKDDLIIAGRLDDGHQECLCYWKNETRVDLLTRENDYSNKQIQIFHLYENSDYVLLGADDYNLIEHKINVNDLSVENQNIYISGCLDQKGLLWDNGISTKLNDEKINEICSVSYLNEKDMVIVAETSDEILLYLNNNLMKNYKTQDIKPDKYFIVEK
jgi:uncharacterized membrane protein